MTGQAGFIEETLLFLLAAVIIVPLFQRVRASPVLGYLIAGAIIGPFGFGLVHDTGGARALAELGIAFLMFTVGLELSLERLRTMRHLIFGIGLAQVAITTVAVAAVAWGLGLPVETAVIIGAALALSSTAIVLRLLSDKGELLSRSGRVVLSILLLQDLAVVPFLALLPALADPTTSLPVAVALTMVRAAAALVVILVLGRLVLRPLLRTVAAAGNPEIFSALVLLVALGTGWATHQAGLSLALGAFLAGLLLAETEYRHQIEADIEPYRGILLGLFFMTIGMLVDGATAIASAGLIVLALIGLLLGKAVLITAIALAFRQPLAIAARTGIVLAQGGEFAFILFALALSQGLMEPALGQILVVVVALSMMLTPGLALLAERVARLLERRRGFGPADMAEEMQGLTDHTIVAGFGRVGQTVVSFLVARELPYVAVDMDAARVTAARSRGLNVFYGDASRQSVLRAAGAERARSIVLTLGPRATERAIGVLRSHHKGLRILARAREREHGRDLSRAGADIVVPETLESSLQLGAATLRSLGAAPEDVAGLMEEFRRNDYAGLGDIISGGRASGSRAGGKSGDGQAGG